MTTWGFAPILGAVDWGLRCPGGPPVGVAAVDFAVEEDQRHVLGPQGAPPGAGQLEAGQLDQFIRGDLVALDLPRARPRGQENDPGRVRVPEPVDRVLARSGQRQPPARVQQLACLEPGAGDENHVAHRRPGPEETEQALTRAAAVEELGAVLPVRELDLPGAPHQPKDAPVDAETRETHRPRCRNLPKSTAKCGAWPGPP